MFLHKKRNNEIQNIKENTLMIFMPCFYDFNSFKVTETS